MKRAINQQPRPCNKKPVDLLDRGAERNFIKEAMMCEEYAHEYEEKICTKCGQDFCWNCCGGTNVHEGGKHEPDYMLCPKCGYDFYKENN